MNKDYFEYRKVIDLQDSEVSREYIIDYGIPEDVIDQDSSLNSSQRKWILGILLKPDPSLTKYQLKVLKSVLINDKYNSSQREIITDIIKLYE